jgi:hypothetical protein
MKFCLKKTYLISQKDKSGVLPKVFVYLIPGADTGVIVKAALSQTSHFTVQKFSWLMENIKVYRKMLLFGK